MQYHGNQYLQDMSAKNVLYFINKKWKTNIAIQKKQMIELIQTERYWKQNKIYNKIAIVQCNCYVKHCSIWIQKIKTECWNLFTKRRLIKKIYNFRKYASISKRLSEKQKQRSIRYDLLWNTGLLMSCKWYSPCHAVNEMQETQEGRIRLDCIMQETPWSNARKQYTRKY